MSDHAISNAKGWLSTIVELTEAMQAASEQGDHDAEETFRNEIEESALSVQIRNGWYSPGSEDHGEPEEFEVLLTTGGPALRIVGQLGAHNQPMGPLLQWQDWGTPWTTYHETTEAEDEAISAFVGCYWFGE